MWFLLGTQQAPTRNTHGNLANQRRCPRCFIIFRSRRSSTTLIHPIHRTSPQRPPKNLPSHSRSRRGRNRQLLLTRNRLPPLFRHNRLLRMQMQFDQDQGCLYGQYENNQLGRTSLSEERRQWSLLATGCCYDRVDQCSGLGDWIVGCYRVRGTAKCYWGWCCGTDGVEIGRFLLDNLVDSFHMGRRLGNARGRSRERMDELSNAFASTDLSTYERGAAFIDPNKNATLRRKIQIKAQIQLLPLQFFYETGELLLLRRREKLLSD